MRRQFTLLLILLFTIGACTPAVHASYEGTGLQGQASHIQLNRPNMSSDAPARGPGVDLSVLAWPDIRLPLSVILGVYLLVTARQAPVVQPQRPWQRLRRQR